MLRVRGANTARELQYANLIILDFSTAIPILSAKAITGHPISAKAIVKIFYNTLTCLISYTTIHVRN